MTGDQKSVEMLKMDFEGGIMQNQKNLMAVSDMIATLNQVLIEILPRQLPIVLSLARIDGH